MGCGSTPRVRPAFLDQGEIQGSGRGGTRLATLSLVPTYDVHARFATLEDTEGRQIDEAELERQLSAVRERLSAYKGRAFGRLDDFIVGVEIEAESSEAARERWFNEIDHAIDEAGLTGKRYIRSPVANEKRT